MVQCDPQVFWIKLKMQLTQLLKIRSCRHKLSRLSLQQVSNTQLRLTPMSLQAAAAAEVLPASQNYAFGRVSVHLLL